MTPDALSNDRCGGAAQAGNDVRFRKDLLAFGRLVMQADKRKTA